MDLDFFEGLQLEMGVQHLTLFSRAVGLIDDFLNDNDFRIAMLFKLDQQFFTMGIGVFKFDSPIGQSGVVTGIVCYHQNIAIVEIFQEAVAILMDASDDQAVDEVMAGGNGMVKQKYNNGGGQ